LILLPCFPSGQQKQQTKETNPQSLPADGSALASLRFFPFLYLTKLRYRSRTKEVTDITAIKKKKEPRSEPPIFSSEQERDFKRSFFSDRQHQERKGDRS